MVPLLFFLNLILLGSMFFYPIMIIGLIGGVWVSLGVHYWNKNNLFQYLGAIPQLSKLSRVSKELFKISILRQANPNLYSSISSIDKLKKYFLFFKTEPKIPDDFTYVIELIRAVFLLEPLLLFRMLKRLDSKRKAIENLYLFVGQIDFLMSIASLRKGLEVYCHPNIKADNKSMIVKEAYHPLIVDCEKNDLRIDKRSILLTGSNMSGKTSFIRTIGINVITGLTLNTCFASHFSMPRMKLYSALRISDDLINSKSYYFEEVLTIKDMIDTSTEEVANLFLLDEIFKGTNTVERISAGKAVLSTLNKADNIVFVSTHDIELADLLRNEYDLFHFSEKIGGKTVDFDYKLKEGKLRKRNAIKILEINEFPSDVVLEARKIAEEIDGQRELQAPNSL
ncbi:DNA mismatch repair protein MutS [Cytophagales bacterium RKSG123]|nr:DNA mismatch repair protein MutS [Xanthovirga aplysinae]